MMNAIQCPIRASRRVLLGVALLLAAGMTHAQEATPRGDKEAEPCCTVMEDKDHAEHRGHGHDGHDDDASHDHDGSPEDEHDGHDTGGGEHRAPDPGKRSTEHSHEL